MDSRLSVLVIVAVVCSTVYSRCCLPTQYSIIAEARSGTYIGGKPTNTQTKMVFYADAKIKMLAYNITSETNNKPNPNAWMLMDFNAGVKYIVIDKACNESKSTTNWQTWCIPEDAKWMGSNYYGNKSANFVTNSWMYKSEKSHTFTDTTQEGCIPVTSSFSEPGVVVGTSYTNFTETIDTRVFDVPKECKKAVKAPEMQFLKGFGAAFLHPIL